MFLTIPSQRSMAITLSIVFLLLVGLVGSPAQAHSLSDGDSGYRQYSHTGYLYIYYQTCLPNGWNSISDSSASDWTYTVPNTALWFVKQSGNCQPQGKPLDIFTGYDSSTGAGIAWTTNYQYYCFVTCWWDYSATKIDNSVIRVNQAPNANFGNLYDTCPGTSSNGCKENALTHEMGHALGLDHVSCSTLSIMNTGGCNYSIWKPQTYDLNKINTYYYH